MILSDTDFHDGLEVTLSKISGGTEMGWEQLMHGKVVLPLTETFSTAGVG